MRARAAARARLGLDPTLPLFFLRAGGAPKAVQLAVGSSVALVFIGLPLGWNRAVKAKWDAYHASRAAADAARGGASAADDKRARLDEELLAEILVNERRAARGAAAVDFSAAR